jgi:hypothetical protein
MNTNANTIAMTDGGGDSGADSGSDANPRARGRRRRLTEKMRGFLVAFLTNGGHATKAAEAAGYAFPDVAGARLRRNPIVRRVIARHYRRLGLSPGEVMGRLAEQAVGFPTEAFGDDGLLDPIKVKELGLSRLVKRPLAVAGKATFEPHNAQIALITLAKAAGLMREKIDVRVERDPAELRKEIAEKLGAGIVERRQLPDRSGG